MALSRSEIKARYRAKHPDRVKASAAASRKKYLAKYPDRVKVQNAVGRKRWQEKYPERVKALKAACAARRRKRNPEHVKALDVASSKRRRLQNPQKAREREKRWRARGGNGARQSAARRVLRIQATPLWGQDGIVDVYKEAEYQQMQVDHIIPLRSKLVCGLHIWDNLQLLTAQENMKKGNKFNPLTF